MGLRISRMGVDMNLYARDDLRYFGRQVVADDVLRGVDVGELRSEARGAGGGAEVDSRLNVGSGNIVHYLRTRHRNTTASEAYD